LIGKKLAQYKITGLLGKGGMGEVYEAMDTGLKRLVALKILPPEVAADPESVERFQREAESLAALSHPNIVTIYSVERTEGMHFLTMERVGGGSLDTLIPEEGYGLEDFLNDNRRLLYCAWRNGALGIWDLEADKVREIPGVRFGGRCKISLTADQLRVVGSSIQEEADVWQLEFDRSSN